MQVRKKTLPRKLIASSQVIAVLICVFIALTASDFLSHIPLRKHTVSE